MSRFLPPDHAKGDERTIGGYAAVHARPAAFEGQDGASYSVELMVDATGEVERPFGGFILFVQWKRYGAQGVDGHLESEFLAWGASRDEALAALGAIELPAVQRVLDDLIRQRREAER
ncbi:MAG: hypothetical protein RLZZ63_732 [Gemmatimonadota bacterium]